MATKVRTQGVPTFNDAVPLVRGLPLTVYLLAALKFAGTLAFSSRYGFHRDEMYYLASSRHPALGYVDYPPITPMLARFDTLIFGTALWSLRLLPILAGTAIVIVAAMIARDLGGGPLAQSVAAFCILVSGIYLGGTWVFETVAFDMLMWAITILLLVRLLRTGDPRWWIAIGVSFGIGLETKYTILALGLGVAVGLILTSERRQLTTPWPWIAALIAAAILAPNLLWQVQHGWPSLSYLTSHHGRIAQETSRIQFVLEQLVLVNLFLLPIVVAGMVWLFRQRQFRLLAWIPIVVEVAFLLAGGKSYYATPVFVVLYSAGSVALETYLSEGRRLLRRAAVLAPATLLARRLAAYRPSGSSGNHHGEAESLQSTDRLRGHDWLAGVRPHSCPRVRLSAACGAGTHADSRRQLRRGWCHRPLRLPLPLAPGPERASHVLLLEARPRGRQCAHPRRSNAVVVGRSMPVRPTRGDRHQQPRCSQRGVRQSGHTMPGAYQSR